MQAGAGHRHRRWRLSGHKKPHIDVVRNDINVTPLVDVMLVLLIIFMLMTLLMGRGHDVGLPKASKFSSEPDHSQPVISIDETGKMYVEKELVGDGTTSAKNLEAMDAAVDRVWKEHPEGALQVYLKADSRVTFDKVYPVLEHIARGPIAVTSIDLAVAEDK